MARWQPQKHDVLDALASEILHNYARGRVLVAIDGPDDTRTPEFADALAVAIRETGHHVVRASMDGFLRPRAERGGSDGDAPRDAETRGASDAALAYFDGSFDYSTFRRSLVEPFRMGLGASFVTRSYDPARDAPAQTKWHTAPADSILLVDGVFLNRSELSGVWNFSVWIDVPDDPAVATSSTDARRLYQAGSSPRTRAVAIIDLGDVEHPRRVFADSC